MENLIGKCGYCGTEMAVIALQQASFKVDGTTITIKAGEKTKVTRKYTYEQSGEID